MNKYIRFVCNNCGEYRIVPEEKKADFASKPHICDEIFSKNMTGTWIAFEKESISKDVVKFKRIIIKEIEQQFSEQGFIEAPEEYETVFRIIDRRLAFLGCLVSAKEIFHIFANNLCLSKEELSSLDLEDQAEYLDAFFKEVEINVKQ